MIGKKTKNRMRYISYAWKGSDNVELYLGDMIELLVEVDLH